MRAGFVGEGAGRRTVEFETRKFLVSFFGRVIIMHNYCVCIALLA